MAYEASSPLVLAVWGGGDLEHVVYPLFVWAGTSFFPGANQFPVLGNPGAGAHVDGICQPDGKQQGRNLVPAIPGLPVKVEAAAAFSLGASLEATANGRVQTVGAGKAVLRAL